MSNLKKINNRTFQKHSSNYYELLEWVNSSKADHLPKHLKEYNAVLDVAHDLFKVFGNRARGVTHCAKLLTLKFPSLPRRQAENYIYEAINMYYCETLEDKETYRNLKLKDLDKLLAIAYEQNDIETCRKIIADQCKLRKLFEIDAPEIPSDLFRPQIILYSINPEDVGLEKADRKELWDTIQKFNITKEQKQKLAEEIGYAEYEEIKPE